MPPSASRVASRFHGRSASSDPREAVVVEKIKRVIARITGYGVAASKQVTRDNAVMLDARRNQVVVRGAGGANPARTPRGYAIDVDGPGRIVVDVGGYAVRR